MTSSTLPFDPRPQTLLTMSNHPTRQTLVRQALALLVGVTLALSFPVGAATPATSKGSAPAATPTGQSVKRSEQTYTLPAVNLMGPDGKPQRISKILDDGRPVVLTFFYSSCTTVCPVTSQVLTQFVHELGSTASRVNVLSISIDPDHDTVSRLAEHAHTTQQVGGFYTGDPAASEAVQRAFDAWRGDKMNHEPVIFLRGPKQKSWVRLDGLVSPQRLMTEYRQLTPG